MDMFTMLQVLRRHWIAVVAGLVLTAVAAMMVSSSIKPTFSSKASFVLLNPSGELNPNPYLGFSSSLEVVGQSLILVTTSETGVASVVARGGSDDFTVTQTSGAIIEVEATAPTADQARVTVDHVLAEIEEELAQRQDDVDAPGSDRVSLDPLTQAIEATPQYGSRNKAMTALVFLGLALTIGAAYALDGLSRRRKRDQGSAQATHAPIAPASAGDGLGTAPRHDDEYDLLTEPRGSLSDLDEPGAFGQQTGYRPDIGLVDDDLSRLTDSNGSAGPLTGQSGGRQA
jgi:hypothetical protein